MLATIGIEDLKIECIIGDLPQERETAQQLLVTVAFDHDVSAVAESDSLEDTVDYVAVADFCRVTAVNGKYRMIEALAAALVDGILEKFPVTAVSIRLRKPEAILEAAATTVQVRKERGKTL